MSIHFAFRLELAQNILPCISLKNKKCHKKELLSPSFSPAFCFNVGCPANNLQSFPIKVSPAAVFAPVFFLFWSRTKLFLPMRNQLPSMTLLSSFGCFHPWGYLSRSVDGLTIVVVVCFWKFPPEGLVRIQLKWIITCLYNFFVFRSLEPLLCLRQIFPS